jgi:hypothetical protein
MYRAFLTFCFVIFSQSILYSQVIDSVDVTFFYEPTGNPTVVYLPGEFNNWANNIGGNISDPRFAMTKDPVTGIWSKTERLKVGGPVPLPSPTSIQGAYQYKFNENGSSSGWLPDPLNPRQNNNSLSSPQFHEQNRNSKDPISGDLCLYFPLS